MVSQEFLDVRVCVCVCMCMLCARQLMLHVYYMLTGWLVVISLFPVSKVMINTSSNNARSSKPRKYVAKICLFQLLVSRNA